MSAGVNRVTLIGNLGRDPEIRYVDSGNAVCNLRVAITERVKSGDDWQERTEWVDVVVFGKTAESCAQYLNKGRQVYVEGRLQTREYEKDGEKRRHTEVVARDVLFLGSGKEAEQPRPTTQPTHVARNGAQPGPNSSQRPPRAA